MLDCLILSQFLIAIGASFGFIGAAHVSSTYLMFLLNVRQLMLLVNVLVQLFVARCNKIVYKRNVT